MKNFSKTEEIEKIIRNVLIEQSELEQDKVLNSLSTYGTELDKVLEDTIYVSIDKPEVVILYELQTRESSSDVSFDDFDEQNNLDIITYDKAHRVKLIMYGNDSSTLAMKLIARLRTAVIRQQLYDSGVYLEKVSDPHTINEYKNETMWLRNDIDIDIAVKYAIPKVTSDTIYEKVNYEII